MKCYIMKCKNCGEILNPLLLKQAIDSNGELFFDVECVNLECRLHNWISKENYLYLRRDYIKPYLPKLNNKLPYELNTIFVSQERCGISWIIKILSNIHESMFGIPIEFVTKKNTEISALIATRNRLPLPKKWNNVYNVDPQALLNKKDPDENQYDRVVIVQRDHDTMIKAHELYFNVEWTGEQRETAMRKTEEHYQLVYGKEINDPRCKKFRLEDLNNYTISTFNEMLDFLNFPSFGRPIMIPINPSERNWQVYSSVLNKNQPLCNRLKEIEKNNETI